MLASRTRNPFSQIVQFPRLGTFAVVFPLAAGFAPAAGIPRLAAAAAVIATGYTAQAVAGAWLLRRVVGDPIRLVHPREIALFLAVAGPVHTVPAAAAAAAIVCWNGVQLD